MAYIVNIGDLMRQVGSGAFLAPTRTLSGDISMYTGPSRLLGSGSAG